MFSDDYNNEEINEEYSEDNVQEDNYQNEGQNKTKLWIVIGGIALVIIIVIFLVSKNSGNPPQVVTPNLLISSQKEYLSISNNIQLSASVTNFQNAVFTWTSSNPTIATVEQNGLVSGVGYGTTIITATYLHTDNMPYSVSCEVTVSEGNPNISITDVRFQEGEILISVGSEYDLPFIIEPSDGYITNVSYTSSDERIVTVDREGRIKAISVGESVISLDFNNGQFKDEINVNVTNDAVFTQVFIPVINIEFMDKLLKLEVGDMEQLNYQILPQDALTSNLRWESSNEKVATVSNGIITALSPGVTDITLTSLNGVSEIMTVEVVDATVYVTGINVNSTTIDLKVGETSQIVANVTPADATNKTISYSSNSPSIASVDANGLVTANSKGTATITLTAKGIEEGSSLVTTNITVNVKEKESGGGSSGGTSGGGGSSGGGSSVIGGITASPSSVNVSVNNTSVITVSFKDDNDKVVRCYSSNTNIVKTPEKTDNSCTVKGISEGKTTVTIVSSKSSVSVSVNVVRGSVISVSSSYEVKVGSYLSINPTVSSGLRVTSCDISDSSIATASVITGSGGVPYCSIKGVKEGSATLTITATGNGESKSTTTTIKVSKATTSATPTCTAWSKGTSEVIYKVADTSACSIYNVSNCTGEECTVCENKKYSYSYKYKKTDGKTYIAYYTTGYNTTNDALNGCNLSLASLSGECAKATLNGQTCEKTPVNNSCSTYPVYNRVKYTRTCS